MSHPAVVKSQVLVRERVARFHNVVDSICQVYNITKYILERVGLARARTRKRAHKWSDSSTGKRSLAAAGRTDLRPPIGTR